MKLSAICLLLLAALPGSAHSKARCPEVQKSVLINIPGYEHQPGAVQPKAVALLEQCMQQSAICLLLTDGTIAAGEREAQVRVVQESVVFAFVQHLRTHSRSYCAFASLVPEVGGDVFWTYRTFTPNGGWIGEDLADQSTRPKTSRQMFSMLSKNFKRFLIKMRELQAAEHAPRESYGYRPGERP